MFESILKKIKPNKKEQLLVNNKLKEFLSKLKLKDCEAFVGGSYAKNTWLKGNHDIDIFILFKYEEEISNKLEVCIKNSFKKYERIHGSRDYFLINFKGLNFELIPVLKINNYKESKNMTDVSQLHVKWVKKNLNYRLCDEVRLTKQFCRANRVYGAETFIGGLHGYLLEILVYNYGSFIELARNVAEWKEGLIIDVNKHSNFESKQIFPLIVIDPVQPNRNAAAALSFEKFKLFVNTCKDFLKMKDLDYFKVKKFSLKNYNLILKARALEGSNDVSGTKLLKAYEFILNGLKRNGFTILKSDWNWNKEAYFCYEIKDKKLSKFEKYFGPPLNMKENVKEFKNKYKSLEFGVEDNRIYVVKPRKFNDLNKFIKVLIKDKEIKNRIKKIQTVK